MALVVIVETGTGKADANSYATVAEADAYFASRPRSAAWAALAGDEAKGSYLVHATRYLDAAVVWDGCRASQVQALEFPRLGIAMDYLVPVSVKLALYETAYGLIGSDITAEPATTGLSKIVVGPIEIDMAANSAPRGLPRFVRDLVRPYGQARGGNVTNARLVRT